MSCCVLYLSLNKLTVVCFLPNWNYISKNLTMEATDDLIGNGAWSLLIKNLPIDCLSRSLGTISGKGSTPICDFASQ